MIVILLVYQPHLFNHGSNMKFTCLLVVLYVSSLAGSLTAVETTRAVKPNVLLICVDDLKPAIGCFGDKSAITPNIDRLAGRGLRFDRAYCNQAVCSPSRNALLTGLRPQTLGIYDLPTNFRTSRPDAVTIGQYFRQHGYKAQAMGKIFHVGHGNGDDAASWDVPHFRPKGISYAIAENGPKANAPAKANTEAKGTPTESADVPDDTYGDGLVAAEAVRRLAEASKSDQSFFMAVGFSKPHLPFIAPKKYWDLHDPDKLPQPIVHTAPEGAPKYAPQFGGELRSYRGMPAGPQPIDPDTTRHLIHGYYAATSYMDAQLGKVLEALDKSGLANSTIVVLWGDHGWHLGDHGMWCKHTNYEQAARIPLVVSVPASQPGFTSALVESVDIYPTLAELAGLPAPTGLDGRSFANLFQQPQSQHRDHAIHVYPRNNLLGRAIRTDRYRLVEWKTPGATQTIEVEYELYDYQLDPNETKNLATSQPAVRAQLMGLLATHPAAMPQIKATVEAKPTTPQKSPGQDRQALFAKRDKNSDGKLNFNEFMTSQPDPDQAQKRFGKFDKNGDGMLSQEEFVHSGK
jgi:iduronate 2-sulfatase